MEEFEKVRPLILGALLGACPSKTLFVIAFTNTACIGTQHNANRIIYPYA